MDIDLNREKKFTFAAIAAMSLVSLVSGRQTEDEIEEIYIQIHESEVIASETEFALEALEELKERLQTNFADAQDAILSDVVKFQLDHDDCVEIVNMALDVVKSNKVVLPQQIDMLSDICEAFDLYAAQFTSIAS